jgi:hypothetical protein
MSQDAPAAELTPEQRTVLQHLVRNTPAAHSARDVSQATGLALSSAIRCLQDLLEVGYVGYGRATVGEAEHPDTVEYLPTLSGLGYARAPP